MLLKRSDHSFLLVEYSKDSDNVEVTEHDIDVEGFSTIRINRIKTFVNFFPKCEQ